MRVRTIRIIRITAAEEAEPEATLLILRLVPVKGRSCLFVLTVTKTAITLVLALPLLPD